MKGNGLVTVTGLEIYKEMSKMVESMKEISQQMTTLMEKGNVSGADVCKSEFDKVMSSYHEMASDHYLPIPSPIEGNTNKGMVSVLNVQLLAIITHLSVYATSLPDDQCKSFESVISKLDQAHTSLLYFEKEM